ncbi:PepSY domain-containing protein [Steroidobacter cummioxidans]|uniref:PepSY domain-containing protein n=1 Tax=Steroidobacter cummioxidans TaxID=1803913 RepID=UPI000E30BAF7|nr:PepSY domain-containing protein [Steroidobacter cummioxidans]
MLLLRRLIILSHRYLGIVISLAVVIWFASGIVMMYAGGMPRLDPHTRIEKLPALDFSRITLSPAAAAARVGLEGSAPLLTSVMERPAYRFQGARAPTLFADTGELLAPIDAATAREIASRFVAAALEHVHLDRTLNEPDQWTLSNRERATLHKFVVDDGDGTEIYVSAETADVRLVTTRSQRLLAWIGTIPHWIYFAGLKTNQPLWYQIVVWTAALACCLSVLGLILAVTQFRVTRPFQWSKAVVYRGWMRWHYISGAIFGVFALTWAFSGLMSMEPWDWTRARGLEVRRDVFSGGAPEIPVTLIDGAALQQAVGDRSIKELGFTRVHGEQFYTIRATAKSLPDGSRPERLHEPYSDGGRRGTRGGLLVAAETLAMRSEPYSQDAIVTRLRSSLPAGVNIVEQLMLDDYDDYYYSRGRQAPLPVLRFKFDDPMQTWIYVDPRGSDIVAQTHRYSRIERWLYNGLHSLDFKFWYSKRPLWDIGMIVLLLGGLVSSVLGLYLGLKRLVRNLAPARRP